MASSRKTVSRGIQRTQPQNTRLPHRLPAAILFASRLNALLSRTPLCEFFPQYALDQSLNLRHERLWVQDGHFAAVSHLQRYLVPAQQGRGERNVDGLARGLRLEEISSPDEQTGVVAHREQLRPKRELAHVSSGYSAIHDESAQSIDPEAECESKYSVPRGKIQVLGADEQEAE